MIQIKNAKELDGMRKANALSAAALKYGGEHIEAGYRSLAYNLQFRSMEGTLNDEDIDGNIQAIIDALAEINCKLR